MAKKVKSSGEVYGRDGRIVSAPLPKEWVGRIRETDEARKVIDRAQAVRDGLIAHGSKSKAEGPQEHRVNLIACDCWPPDGKPPAKLSNAAIVKKVGDAYEARYERTVHRTTILRSRTIGRLPRR